MRALRYLSGFAVALLLQTATASADQITLHPTADVRILSFLPTENYATDILSTYFDGPGNDQRTLIQFDLSSIPANVTIDSATLRLYGLSYFGSSAASSVSMFRVAQAWAENQATWVNATTGVPWSNLGGDLVGTAGGQLAQPYSTWVGNQTPQYSWYEIDALQLTNDLYQGLHPNYGFGLDAPLGNQLTWVSREGTSPAGGPHTEYPELEINYTVTPEPASAAMILVGVFALTLRSGRASRLAC